MASDIDMFKAANGMKGAKSDKPIRVEFGYFKNQNAGGEGLIDDADIQAINNVARMVELGWFDVEFTMFGCAWWDSKDDKIRYRISSKAGDIYAFWEQSAREDILVGNVMKLTRKCPVPSGMKELISNEVKQELAAKIRETYPKEFFHTLAKAGENYDDSAAGIMWEEVDRLEGVFDENKLDKLENLVHYAYSCHRIDKLTRLQLLDWLKEERQNMDDTFISKDIFEKNMYGIAYEENGKVFYFENAQRENVYERQGDLEQKGSFVTPVFHRRYWYNYRYGIPDVMRDFKKLLREEYNEEYIRKMQRIHEAGKNYTEVTQTAESEKQARLLEEIETRWGKECAATAKRYATRWNL